MRRWQIGCAYSIVAAGTREALHVMRADPQIPVGSSNSARHLTVMLVRYEGRCKKIYPIANSADFDSTGRSCWMRIVKLTILKKGNG